MDSDKIISETLSKLVTNAASACFDLSKNAIKDKVDRIFEKFEPYTQETYRKNASIRILSSKDKDTPLADIYVSGNFSCSNTVYTDNDLKNTINKSNNAVITGNGGAGKTIFMRKLWLDLFEDKTTIIPVFIDLRRINRNSQNIILDFIFDCMKCDTENKSVFFDFCRSGKITLILDGFDEIEVERRDQIQEDILKFSLRNPKCAIVVSSRYDSRFSGWQNFSVYQTLPFNYRQSLELVEKIPFDEDTKTKFKQKLTETFFNINNEFISNPLLCVMMMMTFRDNMEIPNKMHIFYNQAFNTLFYWHDATKSYSRKKNLDSEDFQKSFSIFCLYTYIDNKHELTKTEILDYIRKSNKFFDITTSPEETLHDYEESVNLIKQDGLYYVFIHRSFQEYFSALAMTKYIPEKFSEVSSIIKLREHDSVLKMCYDMNPNLVVNEYIKNQISEIKKSKKITPSQFKNLNYLKNDIVNVHIYFCEQTEEDNTAPENIIPLGRSQCSRISYGFGKYTSENLYPIFSLMDGSSLPERIYDHFTGINYIRCINQVLEEYKSVFNCEYEITSKEGKVFLRPMFNNEDKIPEKIKLSIEESLFELLKKHGEEIYSVFSEGLYWCKSEIDKYDRKSKSFDDILGI